MNGILGRVLIVESNRFLIRALESALTARLGQETVDTATDASTARDFLRRQDTSYGAYVIRVDQIPVERGDVARETSGLDLAKGDPALRGKQDRIFALCDPDPREDITDITQALELYPERVYSAAPYPELGIKDFRNLLDDVARFIRGR